jgi:hypothetical protein
MKMARDEARTSAREVESRGKNFAALRKFLQKRVAQFRQFRTTTVK